MRLLLANAEVKTPKTAPVLAITVLSDVFWADSCCKLRDAA